MSKKCQHRTALELFTKIGDTATPGEIDGHVGGTGSYYSKHISVMRRWGFEFDVAKNGRQIASYTLIKMPDNENEYRTSKERINGNGKTSLKTPEPEIKVQEEKKEKVETSKPVDSTFSIDTDWDKTDDVDISSLI